MNQSKLDSFVGRSLEFVYKNGFTQFYMNYLLPTSLNTKNKLWKGNVNSENIISKSWGNLMQKIQKDLEINDSFDINQLEKRANIALDRVYSHCLISGTLSVSAVVCAK